MTNGKLLALRLAIGLAALFLAAHYLGLIGLVVAAPILGFAISKPLIEGVHDGFTWTANQPLRKWQGIYYEFNNVQIRVIEDDDVLWFATDDVIKASEVNVKAGTLTESKLLPEWGLECLTIEGVEGVLGRHRGHESQRFILWARREVQAPWERKRSGALVPR